MYDMIPKKKVSHTAHTWFPWMATGLLLIILSYIIQAEQTSVAGLDLAWLIKVIGIATPIIGAIWIVLGKGPATYAWYKDHKRYSLRFWDNGNWVRNLTISMGTEVIRIKVNTKAVEPFSECRISPQNKSWWKLWGHENENSGAVRIVAIKNLVPEYEGSCSSRDDEQGGQWVIFNPPFQPNGGNLDFECHISVAQKGKWHIGFLHRTEKGRRLAHAKLTIR